MNVYILGIESSCDDTSVAILENDCVLSNITANQEVHRLYGGVVPELASRAHQQNIIPVITHAFNEAKLDKKMISAIAFTRGPGLLGSLLVGVSFSKALAIALNVPLIEIDHIKAHILAHFLRKKGQNRQFPSFPFLCLVVSGGHTQIVLVKSFDDMEIVGKTIDDAAGETFDKAAKILNLPYPGGPVIDKLAKEGDQFKFTFAKPKISEYDFSFSGLKTSFLYFLRNKLKENSKFIDENLPDLCASLQKTVIDILIEKLTNCAINLKVKDIAIAGGVSANSSLRNALIDLKYKFNWNVYIPDFEFTTDNAAMIAIAGYYKYLSNQFADQRAKPYSR